MKMIKSISVIFVFSLLLYLTSCDYGFYFLNGDASSPEDRATSLTTLSDSELPDPGSDSIYSFIIVSDMHYGSSAQESDDAFIACFESLLGVDDTSLRPRFMVNIGDTMHTGSSSQADDYNAFCEKVRTSAKNVAGFETYQIYAVMGNHDTYNDGWNVWEKKIYPYTSYYYFPLQADSSTEGFSLYFLDSGNGTLGVKQLEDLEKRMKEDSRPKIVFNHYPVYGNGIMYYILQDNMERARLLTLFSNNRVKYYFCGHFHMGASYTFKNFKELSVRSYIRNKNCCLVTVNENTGEVSAKEIEF